MGVKRPRTFEAGFDDAQTSFKTTQLRPNKRIRSSSSKPRSTHPGGAALNPIKAKIRDVTRLLERSENLPAGVRIEKERALAGYRQDLEQAETEKRRQQMISKYHMVRFFERQKATRNLKKLKARFAHESHNSAGYQDLQQALHEAEVDINYALFHPLDEKYQSLYPPKGKNGAIEGDGTDNKGARKAGVTRPSIWTVVEKCMTDGTLEALRDGRLRRSLLDNKLQQHNSAKASDTESSKRPNERIGKGVLEKKIMPQEQDGDSGDGFFEE